MRVLNCDDAVLGQVLEHEAQAEDHGHARHGLSGSRAREDRARKYR